MRSLYIVLIVALCVLVLLVGVRQLHSSLLSNDKYRLATQLHARLEDRLGAIDEPSPSLIVPGLWLGAMADAFNNEKLTACKITHILDMTGGSTNSCPYNNRDVIVVYKKLPAIDHPFFDISQYFDEACEFIESALEQGGSVLVHCQAGVSRSAIIVAMYLARRNKWTAERSLLFVKARRKKIQPNIGFIQQLLVDVGK